MASKPNPCTVEEIFMDFRARRTALLCALNPPDVDEFYKLCDPDKDNLFLYGHPNMTWEVTLPLEEVPPKLPEPVIGINFVRDVMDRKDWLSLVALYSDSWLLSVAFYNGAYLSRSDRKSIEDTQFKDELLMLWLHGDEPQVKSNPKFAAHYPIPIFDFMEAYDDYSARKVAVICALTHDVDEFYKLCDPDKDNLCLYGHPNRRWEVHLPLEEVPPQLPEPVIGINFARDSMNHRDWLSLVAMHSDSWLLSVAFYNGAHLNHGERGSLFSLINSERTVLEEVTFQRPFRLIKAIKDKPTVASGSKSRPRNKRSSDRQVRRNPKFGDEHKEALCGRCGANENVDEFWIACGVCKKWFHGRCVQITPGNAARVKNYKCFQCRLNLEGGAENLTITG